MLHIKDVQESDRVSDRRVVVVAVVGQSAAHPLYLPSYTLFAAAS